ncbi:MAG: M17 family metallopeptidase [Gaiellaceae bacterium]
MGVPIQIALPGQAEADVLALPVADPVEPLAGDGARILDEKLGGRLGRLAVSGDLRGGVGESLLLHLDGELAAPRLLLAGVGARGEVDAEALRTAAAAAAGDLGGAVMWLLDDSLPLSLAEQAAALIEGTLLGSYRPGRWKTEENGRREIDRIVIGHAESEELRAAAGRAALLAERVNRARDLANAPPNELTPERLAEHASSLAGEHEHLGVEALGPAEIDRLGMGAFAAVARGSRNEPRLIVLRYAPPGVSTGAVLGLVGKAITFDSGGLSIKPARSMEDMKGDMAGGGAVIEGIGAIAALGLRVRALAVVAACENVIGSDAYRPGDILTAANGKTIEVTNTDAEGRLVLADALWYARREGATHLLDIATLTGAMESALGDLYAGLFANDDEWRERVLAAAERSGDHAWPFPLHPRYRRYVDSDFADLKNASTLGQASPALAAAFLCEFTGEGAWAHLDMSGPGFLERSRGDSMRVRGGTGYGVRLIAELAASL